ncbi:hypothetical protein J1N35_028349 [Gossypium stocksii]|uniref:Uncharacterized protein n=1 Tax=Gossypium stocksii TaxID=47602 RepID=A0A9D3UVT2_9ROSI|nr:hypothetical protein J1N35_028349 [Gossypium stocksii]
MTYPNENLSTNFPLGQTADSSTGNRPSEIDLFASWFVDRLENLGNSGHVGASNSFNLNTPFGQGPSFPSNQGVLPQQLFGLQEYLRLMKEQITQQSTRLEQ